MPTRLQRFTSVALRVAVATVVVLWVSHGYGSSLVRGLLPVFRPQIAWLDRHFDILLFDVSRNGTDEVVRLRVHLNQSYAIKGQVVEAPPNNWLEVTTTVGTVLQPLLLAVIVVLGWPANNPLELLRRLLAAILSVAVVVAIDTPLDLLAYLWDMFHFQFDRNGFSPLLAYQKFMISGGRFALGIASGLIGIAFASRLPPGRLAVRGELTTTPSQFG